MPKKRLNIEDVKELVIGEKYECLSDKYINNYTKLTFRCFRGHKFEMRWNDFYSGSRCPTCYGNKKKTIDEVKNYVESQGYECLSDKYINNYTKLTFRCPKGHEYEATWGNFSGGHRCPKCAFNKQRKTIEEIREFAESVGYKVLSDIYITDTKIKYKCPEGHVFETRQDDFQYGSRCPKCAINGRKKKAFERVKEYVEKYGYECLSDTYENACLKLKFRCPKGHEYEATWANFYGGGRCPVCAVNKKKKTIEEVKNYVESQGYSCLSDKYIRAHTKLKFRCPKGHGYEAVWNEFRRGSRCPVCFNEKRKERMLNGGAAYALSFIKNPSKPQVELFHLVQEIYLDAVLNYPCLNYSIDIAVPRLSLAIEYDGSIYHPGESESSPFCLVKGKEFKYQQKRQKELEEEGWYFLRYRDFIPTKEELRSNIEQLIKTDVQQGRL